MKVYKFQHDVKAKVLAGVEDDHHPINSDFHGQSKIKGWTTISLETLYKKSYKDFPKYHIGKPVVSKRVKEMMEKESLLTSEVEFLPITNDNMELFILNVTNILDCVDYNRSGIDRFKDGSWFRFNKLVFDPAKIPDGTCMFKINETPGVQVFITDKFKEWIEEHKFKGLNFSVIYDSDFTEEMEAEQQHLYDAALEEIERNKGEEYSYDDARELVDQGETMASGPWKMQLDDQGRLWHGQLLKDLSYQWLRPIYIPPVLLLKFWHKVNRLKE
ncbi:imm11 family protein [Paenibacillus sp. QZ-Y1]|uniref:imm11 family protein n=1 Tax=Paenibacillus sp. QZ-Y1 TaxID=3414511 RepID=UPI003F7AE67A